MANVPTTRMIQTIGSGLRRQFIDGMKQKLQIMNFIKSKKCNNTRTHLSSIWVGDPTYSLRYYNQGTVPSTSELRNQEEPIISIESKAVIDVKHVRDARNTNKKAVRMQLAGRNALGMKRGVGKHLVYGEQTSGMKGLADLYVKPSVDDNVIDAKNFCKKAGDAQKLIANGVKRYTSFYVLNMDRENGFSMLEPSNVSGGIQHMPSPPQELPTQGPTENTYTGDIGKSRLQSTFIDTFTWDFGFSMPDYKNGVRCMNIDTNALKDDPSDGGIALIRAINFALTVCEDHKDLIVVLNRTLLDILFAQRGERAYGAGAGWKNIDGLRVPMFQDSIPIAIMDSLHNKEAGVG